MRAVFYTIVVLMFGVNAIFAEQGVAKDMIDREVKIPKNPQKVFAASPPMTVLLYALAPQKMIGVNYQFMDIEKKYMLKSTQKLPVLGSFFSSGNQANLEKVLTLKPDIVFMWDIVKKNGAFFEEALGKFDIPVVYLGHNSIPQIQEAFRVMGRFLGEEKRANKLIEYANNNLQRVEKSVQALGSKKRKRVYLAQGKDGLRTECDGNLQSQIVPLVGGENVHKCEKISPKRAKITLEKLYKYDPDIIFVWNHSFFKTLDKNSPWRNLRAFKEGNIYFSPISPFNWLTRPPSFMRYLGMVWMHNKLYPEHFKIDEAKEIKSFYELFLHVKLNDEDVEKLLKGE